MKREGGMSSYHDLETMIDILSLAIARQEMEERFFRRSAEASSSKVAKDLFVEIADDLARYCEKLEQRKQQLLNALNDLVNAAE